MLSKEKKKTIDDLENELAALRQRYTDLEEDYDNLKKATAKMEEKAARTYQQVKDHIEQHRQGSFILDGESLPVVDLIRVLREELDCTHAELKQLKESVRSVYRLLEPQLGD